MTDKLTEAQLKKKLREKLLEKSVNRLSTEKKNRMLDDNLKKAGIDPVKFREANKLPK